MSFEFVVLDDRAYTTGSFVTYMDISRDYATWFVESFVGPIIGDVPVSGGRVLGGIVCAQMAFRAEWSVRAEAL